MPGVELNFETVLRILTKHKVDYIMVGGICAAVHGTAAIAEYPDIICLCLEAVYSRDAGNLIRLEAALNELNTYYREHPLHRIIPKAECLDTPGHHLLMTSAGPLDLLGSVTGQRGYMELLPHTVTFTLDDALEIRMLALPMLITLKTDAGRDKDKLAIPILQQTLKEIEATQQTQEDDTKT
jgi:hypothetical protein